MMYHKFSSNAAACVLSGENIIVMLTLEAPNKHCIEDTLFYF